MAQEHIIRKQTLEVTLPDGSNALPLQQRVGELLRKEIIPELDRIFSELSDEKTILHLDRVDIDIGEVSLEDMVERLLSSLSRELTHRKESAVKYSCPPRLPSEPPGSMKRYLHSPARGASGLETSGDHDMLVTPEMSDLQMVRHFLQTGTLPWWTGKGHHDPLETTLLGLFESVKEETRTVLVRILRQKKRARHRFVYQFSDAPLLKVLKPRHQAEAAAFIKDIEEIITHTPLLDTSKPLIRLLVWDAVLTVMLAGTHGSLPAMEILHRILTAIHQNTSIPLPELTLTLARSIEQLTYSGRSFNKQVLRAIAQLKAEFRTDATHIEKGHNSTDKTLTTRHPQTSDHKDTGQSVPERTAPLHKPPGTAIEKRQNAPDKTLTTGRSLTSGLKGTGQSVPERIAPLHKPPGTAAQENHIEGNEAVQPEDSDVALQELYIGNSGIVLLWPYLGHFFKNLNLVDDGSFTGEASATRAIHLLQYLSTGETTPAEYFLPLNKVLCGLDIEAPVARGVTLTDMEESECSRLLSTVISHWTAIQNTSIRGFQSSFLQRDGILVGKENGWLLQVERKAYDVLLDRLPWGISVIKLPWMNTLLHVEW